MRRKTNTFILLKTFGVKVAFWSFIFKYKDKLGPFKKLVVCQKHQTIKNALLRNLGLNLVLKRNVYDSTNTLIKDHPAWVCWWDGEDKLPPTVQLCIKSIRKHANCQKVNLVTKDNYTDFVTIPEVIKLKFDKGLIPIQQFVDVLRVLLLEKHGGLWLDATIFLSQDLDKEIQSSLFTVKHNKKSDFVSNGQWAVFLIGGQKQHPLFTFLSDAFLKYFKKYDVLIDYFLMDYFISIALDNVPIVNSAISSIPKNNTSIYFLQNNMNQKFDEHEYAKLTHATSIHKLNWREPIAVSRDGIISYYDYINQSVANS